MISIVVPGEELWDEVKEEFVYGKETRLNLEHSLVSISKWESKWHKPFASQRAKDKKTTEEIIDYIKCMTLTQNVSDSVYNRLTQQNIDEIFEYINNPMTATWFREDENKKAVNKNRVTTSEQVYSVMIKLNIPLECQKWHINRLLTLIRVCEEDNKPTKKNKKPTSQSLKNRAALNAARRKKYNTRG